MLDHGEVVGDEQVGQAELRLQVDQQVDHLGLDRDVERRDRLVADDQLGADRERARDAEPLALAARELVRVVAHLLGPEADPLEQRRDPLLARAAVREAVVGERLADDLARGQARVERGVGVLEDDLEVAPVGVHRAPPEAGDLLALEAHAAGGGSISRRIALPAVDLPQPLSPTSPSVSPWPTLNEMPSTARTQPRTREKHALAHREVLLEARRPRAAQPSRRPRQQMRSSSRRRGGPRPSPRAAGRRCGTARSRSCSARRRCSRAACP